MHQNPALCFLTVILRFNSCQQSVLRLSFRGWPFSLSRHFQNTPSRCSYFYSEIEGVILSSPEGIRVPAT